MKKNILLCMIMLSLFSCDEFIEEELTGGLTVDAITTPRTLQLLLNSTYEPYAEIWGGEDKGRWGDKRQGYAMTAMGTDIDTYANDFGPKGFDYYGPKMEASLGFLKGPWDKCYRGINACNAVVARAPEIFTENDDPADVGNTLGQARFMRALYYFFLVRHWGDVHYTDEETAGIETEVNQISGIQIYGHILEDLEYAVANLPESQSEKGRPTSWAAKMVLADVYLSMNFYEEKSENYEKAAALCDDVINNGPFSLVKPYADLWKIENHDNNSEVIYAVQYGNASDIDFGGNPAHLLFLMEYDRQPGMVRDLANGRPWKRFRPTSYLINLYDDEDERYDGSFKTVWYANNPNNLLPGMNLGDTAIWLPRHFVSQEEKDKRPFGSSIYNVEELTSRIFPSSKKWEQPNRVSTNATEGDRDKIEYRLADAYLMGAEAHALKSSPDQTKALEYLNEIRMRAYNVTSVAELPEINEVTLDVILEEHAKEFASECKRWYMLKRTKKLVERVGLYGGFEGHGGSILGREQVSERDYLRPIPTTQIDRTSNEMVQNPGY